MHTSYCNKVYYGTMLCPTGHRTGILLPNYNIFILFNVHFTNQPLLRYVYGEDYHNIQHNTLRYQNLDKLCKIRCQLNINKFIIILVCLSILSLPFLCVTYVQFHSSAISSFCHKPVYSKTRWTHFSKCMIKR